VIRPGTILLLLTALLADSSAFKDPVTYLGKRMLPRTDLVALGQVIEANRVGTAASVARFSLTEVLAGKESRKTVLLISPDPSSLPEKRTECVLFLRRLDDGRYEPLGRVELRGRGRATKLDTLKEYLRIEAIGDGEKKRKALRDLLMKNLVSDDPFLFFSAARELAHFTERNGSLLSEEDARVIARRAAGTGNAVLKELLATSLANLGRGPEQDKGDAEGVPKTGLPKSRAFKELASTWRKGGLGTRERLALVRELCTRHLRHAGPILVEALGDADSEIRELAAQNLGEAKFAAAEAPLIRLLTRERKPRVLRAAIRSLGVLKSKAALPAILELARDPDLIRPVAFAAARIGGPEARAYLAGLRASHSGESKRERSIRKLVDFLLSEAFARQEEAMEKIRLRRLK
jgi:hypothetical protein